MNKVTVGEGTRVHLNFSISLEDGSEVDTNFGDESVSFVVGDGSLLPGFERLLFGMSPGERQMFVVSPENAFGQPNDDNVQMVSRDQFDDDIDQDCVIHAPMKAGVDNKLAKLKARGMAAPSAEDFMELYGC